MFPTANVPERAGFDSRGRLVALLADGGSVDARSDFIAVLPGGENVSLLERPVGPPGPRTQGQNRSCFGAFNAGGGRVRLEWNAADHGVGICYALSAIVESRTDGEHEAAARLVIRPTSEAVQGFCPVDGRCPTAFRIPRFRNRNRPLLPPAAKSTRPSPLMSAAAIWMPPPARVL